MIPVIIIPNYFCLGSLPVFQESEGDDTCCYIFSASGVVGE